MLSVPDADAPDVIEHPYPFYTYLRDEAPVRFDPGSGAYLVSRFEDVADLALRWEHLSSQTAPDHHDHMASMDPPRHDVHRASVSRLFTPQRMRRLEDDIRSMCRQLLDRVRGRREFDLAEELATLLPSDVITDIVGVPDALRGEFREKALAVASATLTGDLDAAMTRLQDVMWRVVDGDVPPARDRVLATLLELRRGEGPDGPDALSTAEVVGLCTNLVLAGTDTATNLITSTVVVLDQMPEVRAALARDPGLIGAAIEEVLRYESPVQWLGRRVVTPVTLHGVTLPTGSLVRLYWGAANRDDREFDDADRFDLHRPAHRHLAFGRGLHFCLGAALARLEARIAIEELYAMGFPHVNHEGVVRMRASIFRGYEHVPVRTSG